METRQNPEIRKYVNLLLSSLFCVVKIETHVVSTGLMQYVFNNL